MFPGLPNRKQLRLIGFDYSKDGFYFVTIDCKNLECHFGNIRRSNMILNEFGNIAFQEWILLPSRFQNVQLHTFQIMPNHLHGILELTTHTTLNFTNNTYPLLNSIPNLSDRPNSTPTLSNPLNSTPTLSNPLNSTRAGASPAPTKSSLDNSKSDVREGLAPSRSKNLLATSDMNEIVKLSDGQDTNHKTLFDIIGSYKSLVATTCLDIHKQKFANSNHVPILGKIWQRSFWDHIIRDEASFKSISRYIRNNPKKWNRR